MSVSEAARSSTLQADLRGLESIGGEQGSVGGWNAAQIPTPDGIIGRTAAYLTNAADTLMSWAIGNPAQDMDLSGADLFEAGDIPGGSGHEETPFDRIEDNGDGSTRLAPDGSRTPASVQVRSSSGEERTGNDIDVHTADTSQTGSSPRSGQDDTRMRAMLAESVDRFRAAREIAPGSLEATGLDILSEVIREPHTDGATLDANEFTQFAEEVRKEAARQFSAQALMTEEDMPRADSDDVFPNFFVTDDAGRTAVDDKRFHAFLDESLETIRSAATAGPSAAEKLQATAAAGDDPVDATLAEVGGAIKDYREKIADKLNPTRTLALEVLERTLLHRPEDDDGVPFDFATRAEGALDELQAKYAKDYPPDTSRGAAIGAAIGQLRDIISEDGLELAALAGTDIGGAINRLSGHIARVLGADGEMATRPLNTQWLAGKSGAGETFRADALGGSLDTWLGIQKSAAVGASGSGAETTEAGGAESAGGAGAFGGLPNWEDPAFALFREHHDPPVTGFWAKLAKALGKLFGSRQAKWKNLQVVNGGPNAPLDAVKCRNLDTTTINAFINGVRQGASGSNMSVAQYIDALRNQSAAR